MSTKNMTLSDHLTSLGEAVDKLARIAYRIDEEMSRVDLRSSTADYGQLLVARWPGAYIKSYPGRRFDLGGPLLVGARESWQAAWLGGAEARQVDSPLLKPLVAQYLEQIAVIELALELPLTVMPPQADLPMPASGKRRPADLSPSLIDDGNTFPLPDPPKIQVFNPGLSYKTDGSDV